MYGAYSTFVPFCFAHIAAGSVLLIAVLVSYRVSLISVGNSMLVALRSRAKADKRTSGDESRRTIDVMTERLRPGKDV